jgi:hypothetical protein
MRHSLRRDDLRAIELGLQLVQMFVLVMQGLLSILDELLQTLQIIFGDVNRSIVHPG